MIKIDCVWYDSSSSSSSKSTSKSTFGNYIFTNDILKNVKKRIQLGHSKLSRHQCISMCICVCVCVYENLHSFTLWALIRFDLNDQNPLTCSVSAYLFCFFYFFASFFLHSSRLVFFRINIFNGKRKIFFFFLPYIAAAATAAPFDEYTSYFVRFFLHHFLLSAFIGRVLGWITISSNNNNNNKNSIKQNKKKTSGYDVIHHQSIRLKQLFVYIRFNSPLYHITRSYSSIPMEWKPFFFVAYAICKWATNENKTKKKWTRIVYWKHLL